MELTNRNADMNYNNKLILYIYILCVSLFSINLFLYGFFPIKHHDTPIANINDIPKSVNNIKVNSDYLYKPVVQKIIFMVIDALRWDFVNDAHKLNVMPFTRNAIANKSACLLQVKVNAPTVTMPRVKTMTTGSVSSFIDVVLNFGKTTVTSDSVLLQAKNQGHNLIFYGDDTWLNLFPNTFIRYEGTTSFYVSDYTEVDFNVTRHINDELYKRNDWSIMILHYLGLDHIGHVYGPQNQLVKPKLNEMDEIIQQIAIKVQQWNNNGVSSLFIVCGDHGMKNSGGHGGATPEETLVPLVAFGSTCITDIDNDINQIDQVDIATTLAVMLSVPIPSSSIGSVSLNMISTLPSANKLFILYYNANNIFKHFEKLLDYKTRSGYVNYLKAISMHTEWLSKGTNSAGEIDAVIQQYKKALNGMRNPLIQSMIHYNITIMSIAVILMCHVLIMISNCGIYEIFSLKKFLYGWTLSIGLWFLLNCIFYYENNDPCFTIINNQLAVIIVVVLTVNSYIFAKFSWSISFDISLNYSNVQVLLATFLYTMSLSSTSFIEEEHQTWYFFLTTFLVFQLVVYIRKFYTLPNKKTSEIWNILKNIAKIVFILVIHRILRKFNSTGNKYAHLPDVRSWLKDNESNIYLSLLVIIALFFLIIIGYISNDSKSRKITLIFHTIISMCIYLRHASDNAIIRPYFYPQSRGIHEVQIFWIAVMGYFLYKFVHISLASNSTQRLKKLLINIIELWVMISALLHRPHNIMLLPMQLFICAIMNDLLKCNKNETITFYINYCLGNVYFFYQGNSNSLATIDVAVGYIGLQSFILPITTVLLCVHTFSGPILSYLMFLHEKIINDPNCIAYEKIFSINRQYTFMKFFSLTVYTIIITITRYHLFVWSVFSPKLLYETVYCTVIFSVMFIILILFSFTRNKNNC